MIKLSEMGRTTFYFGSRMEADAAASTIKILCERDASVTQIEPYGGEHGDEYKYCVEITPILTKPGASDMEAFLQNAFEQVAEQHAEDAEEGDLDLREANCESLVTQYGFSINLPVAKVAFRVTIEEF